MGLTVTWQVLAVFGIGLLVGSLLHRCVRRLPFDKSLFWPFGEFCDRCLQPIPMTHRLPIIGWFAAGGRCRHCGYQRGWRGAVIELTTATAITALFIFYVGSGAPFRMFAMPLDYDSNRIFALFVYHAVLFCFLILATFIDLEFWIIPDSVTIPGMIAGLALGTFWYIEVHPAPLFWPTVSPGKGTVELVSGDAWGRWLGMADNGQPAFEAVRTVINDHWNLNWNKWIGFMTGVVGLLAGAGVVWIVRVICSWAFEKEAIGAGDIWLMAMVGTFLGWQMVVVAFFLAPLPAVVVGAATVLFTGRSEIPYGPHLSLGTVLAVVFWRSMWPGIWFFLQDGQFVFATGAIMLALLAVVAALVQWTKRFVVRVR